MSTSAVRPIPKLFELFGRPVYDHWKERKIERKGKTIQPTLKFEDPNSNEKENDNDPYICFRRREFRQARKTRRADTIGAERIRLMQKSLHRARDLIMSVSEREILKLDNFQAEHELFKARCATKACKRELNIKGDEYLFFPHKKKKIVRTEDEEREKKREKKKQDQELALKQQQALQQQQQQPPQPPQQAPSKQDGTSTSQPYVKLPPAKVPDMDLVTVSLVLKEKNETIKRAVLEKLRKRKEHDKGFINLTDDPYEPFFDISTNRAEELSHIPYSSIAATHYHQFNTSNYMNDQLKSYLKRKTFTWCKTFWVLTGSWYRRRHFHICCRCLRKSIRRRVGILNGYCKAWRRKILVHTPMALKMLSQKKQMNLLWRFPREYVEEWAGLAGFSWTTSKSTRNRIFCKTQIVWEVSQMCIVKRMPLNDYSQSGSSIQNIKQLNHLVWILQS